MVRAYFGKGKQGWQDRQQRLRYVEYVQAAGRLEAKVRFVYADNEQGRLVWVIAESSLPYPLPTDANSVVSLPVGPQGSATPAPDNDLITAWTPLSDLPADYSKE
jgi:hypothetical protein